MTSTLVEIPADLADATASEFANKQMGALLDAW